MEQRSNEIHEDAFSLSNDNQDSSSIGAMVNSRTAIVVVCLAIILYFFNYLNIRDSVFVDNQTSQTPVSGNSNHIVNQLPKDQGTQLPISL